MDLGRTESSVLPLSQNPGRGMIVVFHPQEKRNKSGNKRKTGDTKIMPREGNASQNDGNPSLLEYPSLLGDPTSCRRSSKPAPGRHLSTPPPLAEFGGGPRSVATDTVGCCVGRTWQGRAAAGGRLALGRACAPRGILKPNKI